jgi:cobalt-zinc-cadmium efflux system outer membrane protein
VKNHRSRARGIARPSTLILAAWFLLVAGEAASLAQGPTFDLNGPPGVPNGRGKLGPQLGSAGIQEGDTSPGEQANQPISGRVGPSGSRAPVGALNPPPRQFQEEVGRRPRVVDPASVPHYGDLDLPGGRDYPRPRGNMTLDQAIEILIRQNLGLIALQHEISMSQADVLTASLRANPIFYADTQLQPYGHYTRNNPGGPQQYDVNVTYPLDVSRKRRARMAVAEKAKGATEAQFQDSVRLQIDNLYTVYVDVVAAEETARYSHKHLDGITKLLKLNQDLLLRGQVTQSTVDALHAQVEQAQLQVRAANHALGKTTRSLAQVLNIPRAEAASIRVEDTLRDARELPQDPNSLIQRAIESRPDLIAYRFGVDRAGADVRLAKANRLSDVYLLYQPYTLQNNSPYGLKSPYSWAVGVTMPLPIYNRNQGNIRRAEINASQTRVELAALTRQVTDEVDEAILEFQLSREAMLEIETEVLPASARVKESALRRLQGGQTSAIDYLEAQKEYNEVVRQYRDALVRHRRSMLDLNTAVGARILP